MPKKHLSPLKSSRTIQGLKAWEDFIWSNIEDFEKRFCYGHQIVDVYFSTEWIRIVWMTEKGMSIGNLLPIDKFLTFMKECKNGKHKIQDN
jgi:hypothetical protein